MKSTQTVYHDRVLPPSERTIKVFEAMNVGDVVRTLTETAATAMRLVVKKHGSSMTLMYLEDGAMFSTVFDHAGTLYDIDITKGSQLDRTIWQRLNGDVWIDL